MLLKLGFGNSLSLLLVDLVSMISGKEEFEAKIEGLKNLHSNGPVLKKRSPW